MEYYNTYTSDYRCALNNYRRTYKVKVELLTDQETAIGEIVRDLDITQGQITVTYERIVRRSCSIGLINVHNKYRPDKNSAFWVNRKFKLYIGIEFGEDTYWWSQGVFYTQTANMADYHTVVIQGVDKGGALNGTIKTGMLDYQYIIPIQSMADAFKDLMAVKIGINDYVIRGKMIMGGDKPLDCKPPILDLSYYRTNLPYEISADANSYVGDLIDKLADVFAADAYYDTEGYFRFNPALEDNEKPILWEFNNLSSYFEGANYTLTLDGENTMCVYTNATGIRNVSYTAYNTNPLSPINIDTGIRRAVSQEIEYLYKVDGEAVTEEQMTKYCRSTANYYLRKNSMISMQLSFNAPIIPHLDVDKAIEITDEYMGFDHEKFIIQSITFPFNSQAMNISCTNINWIPNSYEYDGKAEIIEPEETTNTTTNNNQGGE